jgi:hypothetical protein
MGKLTTTSAAASSARAIPGRSRGLAPALPFLLGLGLISSALGQSAENFDTQILAPDAPAPAQEVSKGAKSVVSAEAGPVSSTPSRFVGVPDLEAYVSSLSSVFQMRGRSHDPFGHPQDPDAKPIIKATPANVARRVAPVQVTPFADIVRLIVVTTIMPGEKRFLVGTRSFKQGDQIPLTFRNKPIRVQITEVTSRQIGFRNLDTGESAVRKLDMLPVGMTPGHRGITAPGMVPDLPNAPIELEMGDGSPLSNR